MSDAEQNSIRTGVTKPKSRANGRMGGRPRKRIDRQAYLRLWMQELPVAAIASRLSVSKRTLQRWLRAQRELEAAF